MNSLLAICSAFVHELIEEKLYHDKNFVENFFGRRSVSLIGSNQGGWHTNNKQKLRLLSWPPFSFMYSPFTTFPSPSNCSIILSWSSQSFRTFNRPHYTENYTPLKGCSQIHVQAHHLQKKVKQDLYSNARSILSHCIDAY